MRSYSVAVRGQSTVEVEGPNWIVALGLGLDRLGRADDIERLACEVLPNGTVIARDVASGTGYIVQQNVDETHATIASADEDEAIALEADADSRSGGIDGANDAEDACEAALVGAMRIVQSESAAVILERAGTLEFVAVVGPHADKLTELRLPAGTGVVGYSMQKRRSVVLGNAAEDPRHFSEIDKMTGYRTREIACVPVLDGDTVFGAIEMLNLPEGRRFTREDVHQLQSLANVLGAKLAKLAK